MLSTFIMCYCLVTWPDSSLLRALPDSGGGYLITLNSGGITLPICVCCISEGYTCDLTVSLQLEPLPIHKAGLGKSTVGDTGMLRIGIGPVPSNHPMGTIHGSKNQFLCLLWFFLCKGKWDLWDQPGNWHERRQWKECRLQCEIYTWTNTHTLKKGFSFWVPYTFRWICHIAKYLWLKPPYSLTPGLHFSSKTVMLSLFTFTECVLIDLKHVRSTGIRGRHLLSEVSHAQEIHTWFKSIIKVDKPSDTDSRVCKRVKIPSIGPISAYEAGT